MPHERVVVEVALHRAAAIDGDLRATSPRTCPSITEPCTWLIAVLRVDDRACRRLRRPTPCRPASRAARVDAHLGHLGEVAAVAEVEGHAHARALRQLCRAPAGLLAPRARSTPRMRAGVVAGACRRARDGRLAEQVEAELHRVLAGRVRQLVDERLEHEADALLPRRAQRARRARRAASATRRSRSSARSPPGTRSAEMPAVGAKLLALAEGDEMVAPGDQLARRVHAALEEVEARRADSSRGACRLRGSTAA